MDIYIKEKNGTRQIRIPWLPSTISVLSGGTRFQSYEILDLGEVRWKSGTNLSEYSWEGIFPGKNRVNQLPFLKGAWKDPKTYDQIINIWRKNGAVLNLIITGTPINCDVLLSDYEANYEGGFGDCRYTLKFVTYRSANVTYTKKTQKTTTTTKKKRNETVTNTKTHKVKSGDTLWSIAKKYLGSGTKYTKIYNLNKTVIEKEAKKRGYSSSNGGHWIFPGTVLKIPT